jgi:hypothetical protein
MRLLALALAVVGLYRARQRRLSAKDVKSTVRKVLQESFATVIQVGTSLTNHAVATVVKK